MRGLTPNTAEPLSAEPDLTLAGRFDLTLDRLLSKLPAVGPVGVAVSGGSDSLALLLLAANWAAARGQSLLALTVDHGLRREAATEAARVGEICAAHAIPHRTLRWRDGRAVQAQARRARHRLLSGAMREAGGRCLLIGHTRDDQMETLLIRARQGSGWYGLGGMDPVSVSPVWPEGRQLFLLRPLLGESRAELRHHLVATGAQWAEDPSNLDPRFERVRVRALLADAPSVRQRLARVGPALSALRRAERHALAARIDADVGAPGLGMIVWHRRPIADERAVRLLSLLLQVAAGRSVPPVQAGVRGLWRAMSETAVGRGRTLGGAWIAWDEQDVLLGRDPGCAAPLPGAGDRVWDGRFERCDRPAPVPMRYPGLSSKVSPPRVLPPGPDLWQDLTAMRLQALTASMKC